MKAASRIPERIRRARVLLATVRHAAMATVNADGTPHNTPYLFMIDPALECLYWSSHPESLHSRNITRTGQLFVVLFDTREHGGGLYIRGEQGRVLAGDELTAGVAEYNRRRGLAGLAPVTEADYTGRSPARLWGARAAQFWVNASEQRADGYVMRDYRFEIQRTDLLPA